MNASTLNTNQLKAVTMPLSNTKVIAGPGSGKTHVIIHRIAYMIETHHCRPNNLLVITFTKSAAEEMRERYTKSFGGSSIQFGTFHSIFYRILRRFNPLRYALENLLSEEEKKRIIQKIYGELGVEEYEDFIEVFLSHLTLMQNHLIQPKYYNPDGLSKEIFLKVYHLYEAYKEQHTKFDFDDMLTHCYYLLKNDEAALTYVQQCYKHILIDEFQDINCVQFEIIRLLTTNGHTLFVVGDDDQSIYRFRGSKPEFLLELDRYYPSMTTIILDENYRSTPNVLRYSNSLIKHNKNRHPKKMYTTNNTFEDPHILLAKDMSDQAQQVLSGILLAKKNGATFSDCAVIYRTNVQARPLLEVLLAANIPFQLKDSVATLYDQWVTKDILTYLHLAKDRSQPLLIERIINRPKRYISRALLVEAKSHTSDLLHYLSTSDSLLDWQRDPIHQLIYHLQHINNLSLIDAIHYIRKVVGYDAYLQEYASYRKIPLAGLMEIADEVVESAKGKSSLESWVENLETMAQSIKKHSGKRSNSPGVILSTMHSAKGLEFENVWIIDLADGIIPHSKSSSATQVEEERRLFYVALTRAKKRLYLCIPEERYSKKVETSPFLVEATLSSEQFQVGQVVHHRKYGQGTIEKIENQKGTILFNNNIRKIIDFSYCLRNNFISWEEK